MEVTAAAIKSQSAQLLSMGISHIILPDGTFMVEADAASSAKWVRGWRKSPAYKKYLRLKAQLVDSGKYGRAGGSGVRGIYKKNKAGERTTPYPIDYEIYKLTGQNKAGIINRAKGLKHSSRVNHPDDKRPSAYKRTQGLKPAARRSARD